MASFDTFEIDPPGAADSVLPWATGVPAYMQEVYCWAYLNPSNVKLLDREIIVSLILWGNSQRLKQALLAEITPEATVLQAAHVYGTLIPEIASKLSHSGQLEVVEVSPLQAGICREKLRAFPQAVVRIDDIATLRTQPRDLVSCFFLLHEIPSDYKRAVINTLLDHVAPGGKAVFVDYHKPGRFHPLRGVMNLIWHKLEPFTIELVDTEIKTLADNSSAFTWSKETFFGGLYQKVVATHRARGLQPRQLKCPG
jgi:SAM-dependent methyltransferase